MRSDRRVRRAHANEDVSGLDPRLDALLDDAQAPPSDQSLSALGVVMAAMAAPAHPEELAGEPAALAAFRRTMSPGGPARALRRRVAMLTTPLALAKLATVTAALALSGTTAAAYAGALPAAWQSAAHDAIGAPAPHGHSGHGSGAGVTTTDSSASSSHAAVGPNLSNGQSAFGLCTAYLAQQAAGATPSPNSPAFANLAAAAASDTDTVTTYCDNVTKTNPGATHSSKPADHPTGPPSQTPPTQANNPSLPPAPAASHPSGPPSSVPPSHPTGRSSNASTGQAAASSHRP